MTTCKCLYEITGRIEDVATYLVPQKDVKDYERVQEALVKQEQDNELDRKSEEELNCAEDVLDALSVNLGMEKTDFDCIGEYITAVFEAQAKKLTAQEPDDSDINQVHEANAEAPTLRVDYRNPQQRTWVGLTDDERLEVVGIDGADDWFWEVCKAIEAKLREKNGMTQQEGSEG